jgi:hypothetical protein
MPAMHEIVRNTRIIAEREFAPTSQRRSPPSSWSSSLR